MFLIQPLKGMRLSIAKCPTLALALTVQTNRLLLETLANSEQENIGLIAGVIEWFASLEFNRKRSASATDRAVSCARQRRSSLDSGADAWNPPQWTDLPELIDWLDELDPKEKKR